MKFLRWLEQKVFNPDTATFIDISLFWIGLAGCAVLFSALRYLFFVVFHH
jgi:hypothetical protein